MEGNMKHFPLGVFQHDLTFTLWSAITPNTPFTLSKDVNSLWENTIALACSIPFHSADIFHQTGMDEVFPGAPFSIGTKDPCLRSRNKQKHSRSCKYLIR